MQRKQGKKHDMYVHVSDTERGWVAPGDLPVFKKMFAELSALNNRLHRLESKLIKFADSQGLENDGSMESVINALLEEVQLIKAGKQYVAVQLENGYITKYIKPSVILEEKYVEGFNLNNQCYKIENGFIKLDEVKLNEMEEI